MSDPVYRWLKRRYCAELRERRRLCRAQRHRERWRRRAIRAREVLEAIGRLMLWPGWRWSHVTRWLLRRIRG